MMKVVNAAKTKVVGSLNVWFPERGYGFVHVLNPDGTISRHFLHYAHVASGSAEKGAIVRFEPVANAKGSLCSNAEVFQDRQELERTNAAAALADFTAPATDASAVKDGQ